MQQESQQLKHDSTNNQLKGVNRQMYDQLKQQIQHMKLDQHELQATKAKQKELETVALLQQKLQYEQHIDNQQQEIVALQARLKDSVQRASKLRQHFEKDKKLLSQQAEKLQDALAQLEQQHVEQLAAKDTAHLQQLHTIRSELEQQQRQWAEERQALQHKQEAFMTDVEEWSQGEVEAVEAAAAAHVQQAEQSAEHWKQRHQEVAADLELVTQSLYEAQQQLQTTKEALEAQGQQADVAEQQAAASTIQLQQQLEAAEQKLQHKQRFWAQEVQRVEQHWQKQLQMAVREQDAKVCQMQAQHALQLDAVHGKLQGVLAKKDATIAGLRAELDATMLQLQHAGDALLDG